MKFKYENMINKILNEAPAAPVAPTKPATTPTKTPSPSKPATPNPSPFRRHKPGSMPEIRPKAAGNEEEMDVSNELMNIIKKHAKFIKS